MLVRFNETCITNYNCCKYLRQFEDGEGERISCNCIMFYVLEAL